MVVMGLDMLVPWWVCWVFLDLGYVAEVVVVVG